MSPPTADDLRSRTSEYHRQFWEMVRQRLPQLYGRGHAAVIEVVDNLAAQNLRTPPHKSRVHGEKTRPVLMAAGDNSMYEATELRRPFLHYQAGENPMYDVTELRRHTLCYHRRVQAMRPMIQHRTNEHERLISEAQAASARLDLTALKAAYLQ